MAFDINADSYPDYDEWGWDEYWNLNDWQTFYDKLIAKYGADEGSRRWLDAWHRQSWGASPKNSRFAIKDWAVSKGLWNNDKKEFLLPAEFVAPYVANQGQVTTTIDPKTGLPVTNVVGVQPNLQDVQKSQDEKKGKVNKGLLIGGGIVIVGLAIVYFVLRAKNKAQ